MVKRTALLLSAVESYYSFDIKLQEEANSFILGEYYNFYNGRSLGVKKEEVPYVKQSVLTNIGVNWAAVSYEMGDPAPSTGRVKANDILLACTAHEIYYVGRKVDFVRSIPASIENSNFCVADIMIIRPKKNKPEKLYGSFLAAFLRSPSGLHQVQRCIRGLRGGHVYGRDLNKYIRVPLPPIDWLERFEGIAMQAEVTRNKAKETLINAFNKTSNWVNEFLETK